MEGQELFEGLISLSSYKPHTITQHRYLIEKEIVNKYNGNNYRIIAISKYGVLTELINIEDYLDIPPDFLMISFKSLLNNYRYSDGGIIGKKIKYKNGKR